ncbi:MAG: sigma-70 family RNA polymerase sigma factor [Bacteroidetes bacterium]|nr:sigma-70 family RNA polymerase sigma factor [Bacteroidota bacterium]
METREILARGFEARRTHLISVAYRMLGSMSEAEDAVQEAWLRLSRSDTGGVENLGGWLTTVVARVCLDMLRSRKSRREQSMDEHVPEPAARREDGSDPEHETLLADSVGLAMLVVLNRLPPAERVAFVLHDMFDLPFEEIATIVDRSAAAARQLASRARRRVQGSREVPDADHSRRKAVVDAFLAAARGGDFAALLAVLDPDVVVRADGAAVKLGAEAELRGAETAAGTFMRRARGAQPALIDGAAGLVWAPGGRLLVVFEFTIEDGRILAIDLIGDREQIAEFDLEIPDR